MGEASHLPSESEIAALLARREYATAAELLSAVCRQQPRNLALRQKLAHVLLAGGEPHKALRVLEALVDDYARAGLYGKAIAQAKKVQQIEPGRRSVEFKLAVLLTKESAATEGGVDSPERAEVEHAAETRPPAKPAPAFEAPQPARPAPSPPPREAPRTTPAPARTPSPPGEPRATVPLHSMPAAAGPAEPHPVFEEPTAPKADPRATAATSGDELAVAGLTIDDVALMLPDIDDALAALKETGSEMRTIQGSALFGGLDTEQLQEVIGGLRLTSVQPGEIIVAEGEPGGSLFLIASGKVRVYARSSSGRHKQVRTLRQGEFFGEISLLTGSRRTATITAAAPCELLELDRETVDAISQRKPEVRDIISAFCRRRSGSTEERAARAD